MQTFCLPLCGLCVQEPLTPLAVTDKAHYCDVVTFWVCEQQWTSCYKLLCTTATQTCVCWCHWLSDQCWWMCRWSLCGRCQFAGSDHEGLNCWQIYRKCSRQSSSISPMLATRQLGASDRLRSVFCADNSSKMTHKTGAQTEKSASHNFMLKGVPVCQHFFHKTLDISQGRLHHALLRKHDILPSTTDAQASINITTKFQWIRFHMKTHRWVSHAVGYGDSDGKTSVNLSVAAAV